jgi:septum formation protein
MLVLASASPRRQELLKAAGISFEAQPADVPEVPQPGESPKAFAERVACEKALAVARLRPNDFVLGADTIVVVDHQILGKPRDASDAASMLRLLSGRTHEVITAACLLDPGRENSALDVRSETTLVTVNALSESEILSYVASGEPMDKAGAYAIQGMASRWIPRIGGDYANVVGLPVSLVFRMLKEHGAV